MDGSPGILNRFGLEGKTALITGSAQRMGFEVSQVLCREGMKVAIVDIQKGLGVKAEYSLIKNGGIAKFFYVDLSSKGSILKMVDAVVAEFGSIDLLVNNARPPQKNSNDFMCMDDWDPSLSIMLSASYYCSMAVIPHMEKINSGSIVNISSIASTNISSLSAGYHVAKAGINQLTKYLAFHAGKRGVRVNAVAPGLIIKEEGKERFEENLADKARWEWCHPLRKSGTSEDVGNAICFLASDMSRFITGQVLTVDGGLTLADQGFLVNEFAEKEK